MTKKVGSQGKEESNLIRGCQESLLIPDLHHCATTGYYGLGIYEHQMVVGGSQWSVSGQSAGFFLSFYFIFFIFCPVFGYVFLQKNIVAHRFQPFFLTKVQEVSNQRCRNFGFLTSG